MRQGWATVVGQAHPVHWIQRIGFGAEQVADVTEDLAKVIRVADQAVIDRERRTGNSVDFVRDSAVSGIVGQRSNFRS